MDEDSILFQAMKNEMMPQVDLAAMRVIDPGSEYDLGVEVRTRNPMNRGGGGSVANPLRMQRQPSDFAGRPAHANANPANLSNDPGWVQQRPAGNVVNQYQRQWAAQQSNNSFDRAIAEAQRQAAAKGTTSGGLQSFRNFLKGLWED